MRCPGGSAHKGHREAARSLSRDEVERIVERFAVLNPYDAEAIPGSVLEIAKENFAP